MFTFPFHCGSFSHHFVVTRLCRCLLQSVRVTVMPWRLLLVISGILAGGIPGFRIELCCFLHPSSGPWCVCVFTLLYCVMGLRSMTHKLSSAYAEMILSYHLLPQQFFFTHNWNLSRHCCVVVCFLCVFVWFAFACVLCFVLFLLLVLWCFGSCSLERDKEIGLCIGPLPVDFCGPTAWPLRELDN